MAEKTNLPDEYETQNMNLREIAEWFLSKHENVNALCGIAAGHWCVCMAGNLMPCGHPSSVCVPVRVSLPVQATK